MEIVWSDREVEELEVIEVLNRGGQGIFYLVIIEFFRFSVKS